MNALPNEGELVTVDRLPVSVGGCAANVAIGLARQGVTVDTLGCVGRDPSAQIVVDSLQQSGIGCDRIATVSDLPTSQTIVLLVKGQDRRFIHVFGANAALSVEHFDRTWISGLKVLYVGGLFVLPGIQMGSLADLFAYCRARGIRTVLDVVIPKQVQDFSELRSLLPHVDYFLPNEDEAARITGDADSTAQAQTLRAWGAGTVVVTQGARGVVAAQGADVWRASAFPVESVDPSGGGDAFAAGLILGVVRSWGLADAVRYGCALGASATMAVGTTTGVFTAAQAEVFLKSQPWELVRQPG
jgi:sugar/nucleoside kinase (ribokinase family)